MLSLSLSLSLGISLLVFKPLLFADESITITTYYPSPYGVYNELTTTSNAYLATTGGNVGIGTAAPSVKLHVIIADNTTAASWPGNYAPQAWDSLMLENRQTSGTAEMNSILFRNYNSTDGTTNIVGRIGLLRRSTGVGDFAFMLRNVGVYNEVMRLTGKGNVGIGTTAPNAKLELSQATGATQLEILRLTSTDASQSGQGNYISWRGPNGYNYDMARITGGREGLTSGGFLAFDTSNVERIRIVSGGNVGIGTTSPGAKLSVNGNIMISGVAGTNKYLMTDETNTGTGSITLQAGAGSAAYGGGINLYANNNATHPGDVSVGLSANGVSKFRINNYGVDNGTDLFTVLYGGNVGIGTTSPSYKLQLSTDSAAKPGTTTWTVASDRRLKKDIRPYTNGLTVIKKISPVWFKYNGKGGFPADNQEHIGVIGQEIAKVAPYTVNTFKAKLNPEDKAETELVNFNPHALIFDLINSVKELDANITKLAQENQELKKANKELNQGLSNFQERLSRLEKK